MILTNAQRAVFRGAVRRSVQVRHQHAGKTALEQGGQFGPSTKLNYAHRSVSETYGQLVDDSETSQTNDSNDSVRVIKLEELRAAEEQRQNMPHEDHHAPGPLRGLNESQAGRFDPSTAEGKTIGNKLLVMPHDLATRVNKGLQFFSPQKVRENTSKYYLSLQNGGVHKPSIHPIDVDTHVAGVFLQNYASAYNVLTEARSRMGEEWRPKRVLDVGFGPATGMVAFNEVFSLEAKDGYRPQAKTSVVIGHEFMQKRARALLSAQTAEDFYEPENRVNTKIQGHMPQQHKNPTAESKYDLIMATHQLFRGTHNFPNSVDDHAHHLLHLLAPGGVLVLIERGDPNGFETIARARQIMFRPEDHEHSEIKTPRPWKSGRNIKDTKTAATTKTTAPLTNRDDDPDFDLPPELLAEYSVEEEVPSESTEIDATTANGSEENTFKLEILAPCSHHGNCPLQLGQSAREKDVSGKFNWCKFAQVVQRPKFSIELKKGVFLATAWNGDVPGRGKNGKKLAGSGRPRGRGDETSTFSYLIVKRSGVEPAPESSSAAAAASSAPNPTARIMRQPMKRDAHVIMEVCAPSGQIEQWTVPKSYSKQAYYDARKASGSDLWALGSKTKISRPSNKDKLEAFLAAKTGKKTKSQKKAAAVEAAAKAEEEAAAKKASEAETEAEADGNAMEDDAWNPTASSRRRKSRQPTLRGHDPDAGDGDAGAPDDLEAYFHEIGEIEKNSAKHRRFEKKLRQSQDAARQKKNRKIRMY